MDPNNDMPEGYVYRFVASFWYWGLMRLLRAAAYGLRAFRIRVRVGAQRRLPPGRAGRRRKTAAPVPKRRVKRTPRPRKRR